MSAERAIALAPNRERIQRARDVSQSRGAGSRGALEAAKRAQSLSPATASSCARSRSRSGSRAASTRSLRHMRAAASRPRNAHDRAPAGRGAAVGEALRRGACRADRALALAPDVPGDDRGPRNGLARAGRSLRKRDGYPRRALGQSSDATRSRAASMHHDLPGARRRRSASSLTLGPATFDGDRLSWAWALSQTYALRGDARARVRSPMRSWR